MDLQRWILEEGGAFNASACCRSLDTQRREKRIWFSYFTSLEKNPGGLKRSRKNVIKEREENMEESQGGNIFI